MMNKSKEAPPIRSSSRPQVVTTKKSKKWLIVIVVLSALLLIVVASVGTYQYFNNKPEKVLADALTNSLSDLLEKKPLSSMGTFSFEAKGDQPLKVTIALENKVTKENGQSRAETTIVFAGKTYTLKTDLRVVGDNELYFKVDNLKSTVDSLSANISEVGSYRQTIDPLVAKLDGRWIKVTKKDVQNFSGVSEEKIEKCTNALKTVRLSGSDKKQLRKLFKEMPPLTASESLKSESVAGESSYHYKLDFSSDAATRFFNEALNLDSLHLVKTDCDLNDKNYESAVQTNLDSALKKDPSLRPVVELWVGKKSRRPTKLRINTNNNTAVLDFSSEINFDAKNIEVEVPKDSLSITELEGEIKTLTPPNTSNL